MNRHAEVVTVGPYRLHVERLGADPSRETVILVNGALATTLSFRQTARYLSEQFNVVLYDLPYAGQSAGLNPDLPLVTAEGESELLRGLIDHFGVHHIVSVSWGGLAALLAMSTRPPTLKSAVINSFSPKLNLPMLDYVHGARRCVLSGRHAEGARLLNSTVGKYLPRLLKVCNEKFLCELPQSMAQQVLFHIDQILGLDVPAYLNRLDAIEVPVLFVNGALDDYTSVEDVQAIRRHVRRSSFASVAEAGHFLELEGRVAHEQVRRLLLGFMGSAGLADLSPADATPVRPAESADPIAAQTAQTAEAI